MTNEQKLAQNGYFFGKRDPLRNPSHEGSFMVCDSIDVDGYCIVGDDLPALIAEAVAHLGL